MREEILKTLFPDSNTESVNEVLEIVEEFGESFGIKDDLTFAMLFSQVREEIGSELKNRDENLNYKASVLPKLFKAFREDGLAEKYGRTDEHTANQEMIANIAYANRGGNGDVKSGDGFKYRGRGFIQLTFKDNYKQVQKRIEKYAPECGVNIVEDGINDLRSAVFSFLGFVVKNDLYVYPRQALNGDIDNVEAMNSITKKVNLHTHSYEERVAHFQRVEKFVV
jgi:putative chitinase